MEIMPEHECQRRLLPKLEIQVGEQLLLNLPMRVRAGKPRSRLPHDPTQSMEELER